MIMYNINAESLIGSLNIFFFLLAWFLVIHSRSKHHLTITTLFTRRISLPIFTYLFLHFYIWSQIGQIWFFNLHHTTFTRESINTGSIWNDITYIWNVSIYLCLLRNVFLYSLSIFNWYRVTNAFIDKFDISNTISHSLFIVGCILSVTICDIILAITYFRNATDFGTYQYWTTIVLCGVIFTLVCGIAITMRGKKNRLEFILGRQNNYTPVSASIVQQLQLTLTYSTIWVILQLMSVIGAVLYTAIYTDIELWVVFILRVFDCGMIICTMRLYNPSQKHQDLQITIVTKPAESRPMSVPPLSPQPGGVKYVVEDSVAGNIILSPSTLHDGQDVLHSPLPNAANDSEPEAMATSVSPQKLPGLLGGNTPPPHNSDRITEVTEVELTNIGDDNGNIMRSKRGKVEIQPLKLVALTENQPSQSQYQRRFTPRSPHYGSNKSVRRSLNPVQVYKSPEFKQWRQNTVSRESHPVPPSAMVPKNASEVNRMRPAMKRAWMVSNEFKNTYGSRANNAAPIQNQFI